MLLGKIPQPGPDRAHFTDRFRQDLMGPRQSLVGISHFSLDVFGGFLSWCSGRISQQPIGQRLEPLLFGHLGLGLPFLFIR